MTESKIHKGFTVIYFKPAPHGRGCYKIYDGCGNFKQTASTMRRAKRLIDFCVDKGLWT